MDLDHDASIIIVHVQFFRTTASGGPICRVIPFWFIGNEGLRGFRIKPAIDLALLGAEQGVLIGLIIPAFIKSVNYDQRKLSNTLLLHPEAKLTETEQQTLIDGLEQTLANDPPIERQRRFR